jgi:hypothetical protein
MRTIAPITGVIVAGGGATLFARLLGNNGFPVNQSSIFTIAYSVVDLVSGLQIVSNLPLVVNSVIFNTLVQTDPRWTQDSATAPGPDGLFGYNFAVDIPPSSLPGITPPPLVNDGNNVVVPPNWSGPLAPPGRVRIDVSFLPILGNFFKVPFEPDVLPSYG